MRVSQQSLRLLSSSKALASAVCAVLVGCSVALIAQAEEGDKQFTRRAYVGIGAGASQLDPRTPNESLTVSDGADSGFHGVIGYDFSSRLSAEVYYADLGSAEIAFLGTDVGPIDYQVFGVSGIVYLLNSRSGLSANSVGSGMGTREGLSLFGRVGIGGVTADSDLDFTVNNSVHLALGLGLEYGFSNGFAIRGEYRALDTDIEYASLSILKRFGKVSRAAVAPIVATTVPAQDIQSADAPPPPPPKPAEEPKKPTLADIDPVNFSFDKSDILNNAAMTLDEVAEAVAGTDATLLIEGHADQLGSDSYNRELSIQRALQVKQYLQNKGVEGSNMLTRGFGESQPAASNDTADGRAENRRVEIRIQ